MINSGMLRHLVRIQSATRTREPGGAYTTAWATVATVWAAVQPLEGTERIRAMAVEASATHRVRLWYRTGVTAAMRVLHESRVLEVVSPPIDPDERHVELELLCREVT